MARPSKKAQAVVDAICARLSEGVPLTVICRDEGMPAPRTVRDWMEGDPEVSAAIARAREEGEEVLAEECLTIADTPMEGIVEKLALTDKGDLVVVERRKEDMLGHRKLQIETRLKLLAKFNPKRWGDKVQQELSGPGGGPIQTVTAVERRIVRPADRNG